MKKQLAGRVHVVDCMVDRVCTGRTIQPRGVDVQAEPWRGSIVVLEPELEQRVPFAASVATVPSSKLESDYLTERKFSLVNGMHTVLAFMTLVEEYDDECLIDETSCEAKEYILLKYDRLARPQQRMLEAWRAARIAQLLQTYGLHNIMEWHGCDTQEEARAARTPPRAARRRALPPAAAPRVVPHPLAPPPPPPPGVGRAPRLR